MNRRQKKKAFKRRFGFNPPKRFTIREATRITEHRDTILAAFERLRKAILDLWECIKKPALELAEELKKDWNGIYNRAGKKPTAAGSVGGFPNESNIAAEAAGKRGKED